MAARRNWLAVDPSRCAALIPQAVDLLDENPGRQIDGFLQRIGPGISWERSNWGLSRSRQPQAACRLRERRRPVGVFIEKPP